ncbi:Protein VPRBP [Thelohanellus kitauei]|uniref:Protein VPRBP n=1 Tax=Thelohanellus kitauei TaxID=669202 RepID=A0A0C2MAZ5_THEKT|nr:Protein VPRBP [Thelohanellus kitauei]
MNFGQDTSRASNQVHGLPVKSCDAKLSDDNNRMPCGCVQRIHFRKKLGQGNQKEKHPPRKFERIKEFFSDELYFDGAAIRILKDGSILMPGDRLIHLFNRNRFFPKFYCNLNDTNQLVDSFNGDLVMGCGVSSSGRSKCLMWKYDFLHDDNLRVFPCQKIRDISHAQFSPNDKDIIGYDPNFDVHLFDTETGTYYLGLKNPKRKYHNFTGNYPQSNSNASLIFSNGELYCVKTGKLVHVFDRLQYMQSGIFSVSDKEIIYGRELWDLRTLRIVKQIPNLLKCFLKRSHNDTIYLGYKYDLVRQAQQYGYASSKLIRNNSCLGSLYLIDPVTFEIFAKQEINQFLEERNELLELADISRDGSWIAARNYLPSWKCEHWFTIYEEGPNEKIRFDVT